MWLRKVCLAVVLALGATLAVAETKECTTKIGINGFYDLVLDTETQAMQVTTRNGSVARGFANYTHSVSQATEYYYLPQSFGVAYLTKVHTDRSNEVWLCIDERTCGLCR